MADESEIEHMAAVDQSPAVHTATEDDETTVLDGMYGPPSPDGFYREVSF